MEICGSTSVTEVSVVALLPDLSTASRRKAKPGSFSFTLRSKSVEKLMRDP